MSPVSDGCRITRGIPIELKRPETTDLSVGQGGHAAWSRWPLLVGWAAMLLFALHACTHMVAAGDTWVAMACGRHFVNHGVNTVEPFSANSHKPGPTAEEVKTWPGWAQWLTAKVGLKTVKAWHPTGWVNQNWLTHVIFYKLTTALGSEAEPYYDALVLWKFAIYILAAVAVYFTARTYGVHPALAAVAVCFALFTGRSFFDVRPAGFSNLLVAVLILIFALASYRNALYIWLLVPLIVFWSNVHGGYIYAFLVLVPFVGWHAIMNLPRRWTVAAYSILLSVVLFGMASRLLHHEHLTPIAVGADWAFYLLLLGSAGSLALTYNRRISDQGIIACHVTALCVFFLILLPRFFPVMPEVSRMDRAALEAYFAGARLAYIGIFSFGMLLGAVVALLRDKVVQVMDRRGVLHTLAAGAVAFVAMVIFNPFHLTNLTHTYVISVSKHAERWRDVQEWHRAFDWTNPVGTAKPFLAMYILAWLVLIGWIVVSLRLAKVTNPPVSRKRSKIVPVAYDWRKVDLALWAIAAMTIYMAIRSRRFIPIAAIAACPVLALLLDQVGRAGAALVQLWRTGKLELPPVPPLLRTGLRIGGTVAVAVLGLWWGLKFKYVYLDPWPADARFHSVFMRMTASDAKPFSACEFIRLNKLSGNMFNYWTEGGFIAWGQEPDPQTGRIPLRLFMDGRAQAAYNVATFDLWTDIMSGGPTVRRALTTAGKLTANDYAQTGNWIAEQLDKHKVWVVLMPNNQFDKPFTYGLEYTRDWRIAFLTDKEKLFINIATPKGAQLYQAILAGKAAYPDEYSANLSLGHNLLILADSAQKQRGLELIVNAFHSDPTPAPILEMLMATQFPELQPRVDEVCAQYVKTFEENKKTWAGEDGYTLRLEAARLALFRLERVAKAKGDTQAARTYRTLMSRYQSERDTLAAWKRW
jgi:hypothetical protein